MKEEEVLHGSTGEVATQLEFERLSLRMNLECSVRQNRDVREKMGGLPGSKLPGKGMYVLQCRGWSVMAGGRGRRAQVAENKADWS